MNRRRNMPYIARNKIKRAKKPEILQLLSEAELDGDNSNIQTGFVSVSVNTALGAVPVRDAVVTLYVTDLEGNEEALYHLVTDISGKVPKMALPVVYNPRTRWEAGRFFSQHII